MLKQPKKRGVGFFRLPDRPELQVKFVFQADDKILAHLGQVNLADFYIEGHLRLNMHTVRNYVKCHSPESFLALHLQRASINNIPITIIPSAIINKYTEIKTPSQQLQGIIDYLYGLGKSKIEAKVVHWRRDGVDCKAVHRIEGSNYHIKFLFNIPDEYMEKSIIELDHIFKGIQCSLSFDKHTLIDYITSIGIDKLRGDFRYDMPIAIRGSNIRLIPA